MEGLLGLSLHSFQAWFSVLFRRQFVIWLRLILGFMTSKNPSWKGLLIGVMFGRADHGDHSETHHLGHRAQIRVQIGMESSIVVVDGAIRVFQPVAGEHADHGGSGRHFVFALEQTSH